MIQLFDRVTVDAKDVRRTADGYLTATPRVARTGIQVYSGAEMGRPQMDRVLVYRPEDEVFHKDALASMTHRPMTNDHPPVQVTAANWKEHAVGQLGDSALRDGEFVRIPMVMMDSNAIKDFDSGKRELSFGYSCDVEWTEGVTKDGQTYDAIQRGIRGNHLALVDAARGGEKLRIGDSALDGIAFADTGLQPDGKKRYPVDRSEHIRLAWDHIHTPEGQAQYSADQLSTVTNAIRRAWTEIIGGEPPQPQGDSAMADKSLVIDGITVSLNDTAAQVVQKLMDTSAAAIKSAQTVADEWKKKAEEEEKKAKDAAAVTATTIANKDAEIATLTTKLKDAEVTPEKLEAMATDRAALLGKAKAILGDKLDPKATSADIRKAAVLAHVGDAAKGFDDNQMTAAFATIKVDGAAAPGITSLRDSFMQQSTTDAATQKTIDDAIAARDKTLQDSWKTAGTA